jgi:hypothetical protein
MKTDDFEKRLQRQSPREIPSTWRKEILTAAQSERPSWHSLFSAFIQQISALSRPHRAAWVGLATVWVVIMAMNLAARDNSTFAGTSSSIPSAETMQALKQQRLLFAELIERPEPRLTAPSPVHPVGPRSQRREETATV